MGVGLYIKSAYTPKFTVCMIICFILITKKLILCGKCKENLHTDKMAGAEKVKGQKQQVLYIVELYRKCPCTIKLTSAEY